MIHAAIAGSLERCAAVLIEHYAGAFPLWLAPEQIAVLPVGEAHHDRAREIANELKAAGIRVVLDDANESLGKKIRNAKQNKLPYFAVIGDKEVEAGNVTLESRAGGSEQLDLQSLVTKLKKEIEEKTIA